MTLIKDLGLIAGMIRKATAPANTDILWYDTNNDLPKYFNANSAQWESLIGASQSLTNTLVAGNTTGGNDIVITSGDKISYSIGAFFGDLIPANITANRSWTLPDQTGTIALTSDIPAVSDLNDVMTVDNLTGDIDIDFSTFGRGLVWESDSGDIGSIKKQGAGANEQIEILAEMQGGISLFAVDQGGTGDTVTFLVDPKNGLIDMTSDKSALDMAFTLGMDLIGTIGVDTNDVNIVNLKTNQKIGLYGSANLIASVVNQGTGYFRIDSALGFVENTEDTIPSNQLQTGGKSLVRYNSAVTPTTVVIDEIIGTFGNHFLIVINDSDDNMSFRHDQTAFSTKIYTDTGAAVTIAPQGTATFSYNIQMAAWVMLAATRVQ